MVQGSLNPNITFLGEKLWPLAWNKKFTGRKHWKMPIKSVKMKILKRKIKINFYLMFQGSLNPKCRFLGQKVCFVARVQTHRQKDRQTDTKVNTEEFFLQPIIKDWSNIDLQLIFRGMSQKEILNKRCSKKWLRVNDIQQIIKVTDQNRSL